jgi:catechol 2,3-dioxygenase
LRSVELRVPDIGATANFYQSTWALQEGTQAAGVRYFRATGREHHILALHQGPRNLVRVNLGAADRAAVDELHARLTRSGAAKPTAPAALDEPGGGYGFAFADHDGREFRIIADVAEQPDDARLPDRPFKLSHVVLNSAATDASVELFDVLGFRVRDETKMVTFIGCNSDHHSLGFSRVPNDGVNHIAFELPSIDAVMRGAGRMKVAGYPIQWGVGRHGPGDNVFAYFIDPNKFAIEYTAEMEQVDDATYRVGRPGDWHRGGNNNPDSWNLAEPPTAEFHRVTSASLEGLADPVGASS